MGGGSLHWVARAGRIERFKSGICERLGVKFPGATRPRVQLPGLLGLGVEFPGATRRSTGDRRPYADQTAFWTLTPDP